jgi:hypothetical protein
METTLDEDQWETLLGRIKSGKCTAFLGAAVNKGIFPVGKEIAQEWAEKHHYPLDDCFDLMKVAQFLAVKDQMLPKEKMIDFLNKRLQERLKQDEDLKEFFKDPNEPLSLMADLPLPIYITTNYDDLLVRALKSRGRDPQRELCQWNKYTKEVLEKKGKKSVLGAESFFIPSKEKPVVFHLHGNDEVPESLVIAEDDYFEFLVNLSKFPNMIPRDIETAMANTSLLFIGYSLADWDFRVLWKLLRNVSGAPGRISVAVQLDPGDPEQDPPKAKPQEVKKYLTGYFSNMSVHVFWGKAKEFARELRNRWQVFSHE